MIDGSGAGDSSINRRAMPISAAAETSKNIKQISSGADPSASSSSVDEIEDQMTRFHESLEKRIGEDLLTQTSVTDIISNPDVAEHLEGFRPKSLHLPVEYMNYTVPWRKTDEFPHQMLDRFVPDTSDARYRHDRQVRTTSTICIFKCV
jgi:hypothetical protein